MADQVLAHLYQHASPFPWSLVLVLLLVFLVSKHMDSRRSRAEKLLSRLPSPPFKLPLIGHLHLIGSLPHRSLCNLARKHGADVMLLHLGAIRTLVVSSPRAAKAILRTHDHVFASRPHSAVADVLLNGSTDVAFAPYGDYWRQAKKVITTHLLSPAKVRSNCTAREQEVRLVLARLRAAAAARTAVDLGELFCFFATDVVCHAVLGRLPWDWEQGRNKVFRELIETNAKLLGGFNVDDCFPGLARRSLVSAKAEKHKKRWDELLDGLIDKHASKTVNGEHEEDFIDVLLSIQQEYCLTRENIKAILLDMFQAGTDTTYIALDYAMAELMRNTDAMTKLQDEVRSCTTKGNEVVTDQDLSSMKYLKAVMKETLRLHPPAPLLVPHFSMADCDVEGYTIPSGTRVVINAWALGRDPAFWDNPEEFMPERFMEESMDDAASEFQWNDFRFLPFGSGRRVCPGINFTISTFQIILANLMYHFTWRLPPGLAAIDMEESFGIGVHRKEKLLLIPCVAHQDV